MFDGNVSRIKEYLRSKLPDYLHSRGISIAAKFRCLNPQHDDKHPSMSYNPRNHTVHCFSCNATYDIFDLIAMDFGYSNFKDSFSKACEMYIGAAMPLPGMQPFRRGRQEQGTGSYSKAERTAVQAAAGREQTRQDSADRTARRPQFMTVASGSDSQGAGGGQAEFVVQPRTLPAGPGSSASRTSSETDKVQVSYGAYLKQCEQAVDKTDYFRRRGISEATVKRFHLGYDEAFNAGAEAATGQQLMWRAAIIPYSEFAYMARNTDMQNKDRVRKRGRSGIFNVQTLQQEGPVFITEGEFDALSLETLGYKALSLGGVSNVHTLLHKIEETASVRHVFYLCLDNDKAGAEATQLLSTGLYQLQQPFYQLDISSPFKDPNEALVKDPDTLRDRLQHLEDMLALKLSAVTVPQEKVQLIAGAQDLLSMQVSPGLYALCATPAVCRTLLRSMAGHRQCNMVIFSTPLSWQQIRLSLTAPSQLTATPYEPADSLLHVKALLLDRGDNIVEKTAYVSKALRLQKEHSFAAAADLMTCSALMLRRLLPQLAALCSRERLKMLLLCPEDSSSLCEALCTQTLQLRLSADGTQIMCRTVLPCGRPVSFLTDSLA